VQQTTVRLSIGDIQRLSAEFVCNARILYPDLPAVNLVERIIDMAEPEFLAELDGMLRAQHFIRVARMLRSEERRQQSRGDWLFPDIRENIEKLPRKVDVGGGKTKERADLIFEDLKRRLRVLSQKNRARLKDSAEVVAIQALMRIWPPRSRKTQGTTLGQVDVMKARKAGLIE
jgi:hypothetical protein